MPFGLIFKFAFCLTGSSTDLILFECFLIYFIVVLFILFAYYDRMGNT